MPNLDVTFSFKAIHKDKILNAFDHSYPGRPEGTSKGQWAKQKIKQHIRDIVLGYERGTAAEAVEAIEDLE